MECYQYFRLEGPPFQPASPRSAVYFSPTHLQALTTLESGLGGELIGLTLLTGEAGTGKTTLIYSLLQRDHKRVRIAHIDDPKLSFLEIMQVVMTQLKLYSPGSTKLDYLNTLDHLLELHGETERIAIVIDEAQLLSDDVLEELRLLSNHGLRNDGFLRVILVGQPELAERLKTPGLRALNQRITARDELRPLSQEQAKLYVECKLSAQNGKTLGVFEPGALNHLLRRSEGIPRKINVLCHTAMMTAFTAGERRVSAKTAKKVAAEYHDSVGVTRPESDKRWLVAPALVAGTAVAALLAYGFIYPDFRSGWALNHIVSFDGAIQPAVPSAKAIAPAAAKPKANTALVIHPVTLRIPPAPGAAAPASPRSAVPGAVAAAQVHPVPAAAAAGIQKPSAVAAAPSRRNQITVRYGDTLEKIAIHYLGAQHRINELIQANPQLTNINQLSVGQIIYLPSFTSRASR